MGLSDVQNVQCYRGTDEHASVSESRINRLRLSRCCHVTHAHTHPYSCAPADAGFKSYVISDASCRVTRGRAASASPRLDAEAPPTLTSTSDQNILEQDSSTATSTAPNPTAPLVSVGHGVRASHLVTLSPAFGVRTEESSWYVLCCSCTHLDMHVMNVFFR